MKNSEKIFIYHATAETIDKFNLNYLEFGEHNFGPGIYFSTKSDNIDFYLNEDEINGKIYKTEIDITGMVLYYDLLNNKKIVEKLVDSLPFDLTKEEKEKLISKYNNKNYLYIFDNLPYEIYKMRPELTSNTKNKTFLKDFLINMSKNTGINSMFVQNGTFRDEIVVFNPDVLEIKENILENKNLKKEKQIEIKNLNLF